MRKRAKDWFQSVAYTRLMDSGAVILMMTRWHEDDLAGWLLAEHADEGWEVLNIPAEPAPWPERYPEPELQRIRRMIGPREWSALYMQSPVPGGGGEFRRTWIKHYLGLPQDVGEGHNKYILCDPAGEQRKDNDYTSIWVVGLAPDQNYYLLDAVRDRLNLTERGKAIMRLHRKWKPMDVRYERYGMMADIQYIMDLQERENYRFSVTEVAGRLKKEDRIRRLVPLFEQGKVYLPQNLFYTDSENVPHDLVTEFVEKEFCAFPAGLHDDMLDSLSRIAEPDLPLVWPLPTEDPERKGDRYSRRKERSLGAWAA
jgi:predicted phage terminase large subunit-like protein